MNNAEVAEGAEDLEKLQTPILPGPNSNEYFRKT